MANAGMIDRGRSGTSDSGWWRKSIRKTECEICNVAGSGIPRVRRDNMLNIDIHIAWSSTAMVNVIGVENSPVYQGGYVESWGSSDKFVLRVV